MTKRSIGLDDRLSDYILSVGVREHPLLTRLREETSTHPKVNMQISADQGAFMALLTRLIGARSYIEIGVFTGYSSLAVALALPEDGRVVACDISEEYTAVARRYWREAGVEDKIDLRLAPAIETLHALLTEGRAGTFDLAFIDADKELSEDYYEKLLVLLRPGGLLLVDNTLWSGRVADPTVNDPDTRALRRFNEKLRDDDRVDLAIVPTGDGLTLARKK